MTTELNETVPVVPDVRATQHEARRIAAILKWPFHLIAALVFAAWAGFGLVGQYAGKKGGSIMLIVMGVSLVALSLMRLFRKQVLRAFLGAQTPMVFEDVAFDSGIWAQGAKQKITWITGFVAGGVVGFASTKLLGNQGEDVQAVICLSCFTGAGIAATLNAWARTRLWEFILSAALQIVMLGILQTFRVLDSRAMWILFAFAIPHSCIFAMSFFLRWRRWVKSLPETVKTGEA
jgi:hypothetical protein